MGNCLSAHKHGRGLDSSGLNDNGVNNISGGAIGNLNNSVGGLISGDSVSGVVGGSGGGDGLVGHSVSHHHNHPGAHHVRNNPSSLPPLPDSESNAQVCFCLLYFYLFCLFCVCLRLDLCLHAKFRTTHRLIDL